MKLLILGVSIYSLILIFTLGVLQRNSIANAQTITSYNVFCETERSELINRVNDVVQAGAKLQGGIEWSGTLWCQAFTIDFEPFPINSIERNTE